MIYLFVVIVVLTLLHLEMEYWIMSKTVAELVAEVTASKAVFEAYKTAVGTAISALDQKITDLQSAGVDITPLAAVIDDFKADLDAATVPN